MHAVNGVDETEDGHHCKPYYIVGGTESFFAQQIPVEVASARVAICNYIGHKIYPNDPVIWVGFVEVQQMLARCVQELKVRHGNLPVVSCSRFYYPGADAFVECNRVVDSSGEKIGVGPRPYAKSIPDQVGLIRSLYPNTSFIVVDDMLFHGDTINQLRTRRLPVRAMAAAFATGEAKEALERSGIEVCVGHPLRTNLRDMLPLHDFLPPLPLCGKVVGLDNMPLPAMKNDLSSSFPYLLPWITPEQLCSWASIPESHAVPFSMLCLKQCLAIFSALRDANIVRLSDLAQFRPRASCPYTPPSAEIRRDTEITTMLAQAHSQLSGIVDFVVHPTDLWQTRQDKENGDAEKLQGDAGLAGGGLKPQNPRYQHSPGSVRTFRV